MPELAKTVTEIGVTAASVAFLFYLMLLIVKKAFPSQEDYITKLEALTSTTNQVITELSQSTDNTAEALTLINNTMEGWERIMSLLLEDTKETQNRLYTHDDRSEKMYTMLRELCQHSHKE